MASLRVGMRLVVPMQAARTAARTAPLALGGARAFSLWPLSRANNDAAREAVFNAANAESNIPTVQTLANTFGKSEPATITERISQAETPADAVSEVAAAVSETTDYVTNELSAYGLGGWSPSGILQHVLDATHYYTGLPWWATIIAVTCGIRFAIAPLLVNVQGNSIRLANIQPKMQEMMADMEYAKATGNQQQMQAAALRVRKLLSDNNCSPFRSLLLPAVQMPIFLSFYFALDGLSKAKLPSMTTEGAAWFTDLTTYDPYYVLPIASSVMTLLVLESGAETGTTGMNQTPQARMVKNVLRGVTVLAAWFVSEFPAALLLYWTTTNTFSFFQLLVLRTRFMKRWLKLPEKIEHPVQPVGKQKSFMDGLRSGVTSQKLQQSSNQRQASPASLWARKDDADVRSSRARALDAMLDDKADTVADPSSSTTGTLTSAQADKQKRLQLARERRLRQRA
ncbi:hypothetical protein MCUN1_001903 [Malassezia cuniculi]|uniref:Membrane insertase YidC/Oxa/ALB C-terminal domain-containing protein n=1 Tax=Malassezia cuniculi TaxID=948313 RepID=A0AAF0J6H3_9BASI|nr:hypothetical protein MCUN1_001903 [Malassezia cuniculi]